MHSPYGTRSVPSGCVDHNIRRRLRSTRQQRRVVMNHQEESKMPAKVDVEACEGCGACVSECPTDAIEMNGDGKAVIDEEKCADCGACLDVCPVSAISLD